jgi:hypothetical protein
MSGLARMPLSLWDRIKSLFRRKRTPGPYPPTPPVDNGSVDPNVHER